jgi:hypothetical protein
LHADAELITKVTGVEREALGGGYSVDMRLTGASGDCMKANAFMQGASGVERLVLQATDKIVADLIGKPTFQQTRDRGYHRVQPVEPVAPQISGGEISEAVGYLTVEGSPRGARVEILDSQNRQAVQPCGLPCRSIGLKPGVYSVKVNASRYSPFEQTVAIELDKTETLQFRLKRLGSLSISGSPAGSRAIVTGPNNFREIRGLPMSANRLHSGTYKIEVSRAGYETYSQNHEVLAGKETKVAIQLNRVASLEISGTPARARLLVTGPNNFRVKTRLPYIARTLPPGTYHVKIGQRGYVTQEKDLVIAPAATAKWTDVELESIRDFRIRQRQQQQRERERNILVLGNLMWQRQAPPERMNWSDAKEYCANFTLGGYSDWRLPEILELRSIIRGCDGATKCGNLDATNLACRKCELNQGPANGCYWDSGLTGECSWFWSSTSHVGYSENSWGVSFNDGSVTGNKKHLTRYIRCVRRGRP